MLLILLVGLVITVLTKMIMTNILFAMAQWTSLMPMLLMVGIGIHLPLEMFLELMAHLISCRASNLLLMLEL